MSQSFGALGVSAEVEHSLAARGIVEPFRIQSLVVPVALEGRDILGKAPTGSGKTLAFGLPIVELVSAGEPAPAALVLAPTRELALQVTEELTLLGKPKGIRAAAAYGGAPVGAQVKRLRGVHVVVATPGRLNDLVQRRLVSLENVRILILDEADRMLDMGFQPQVDRLVHKLRARGVEAAAMHGDMTQGARERALERFRSGKVTTLVATDVAARGLDLDAISHVINYDPPADGKGYVHRVGRTGRAGRSGQGITLVLPEQQADVSRFATMLGHREQFEATGMKTARPKLMYTSRRGRRSKW